MSSLTMFPRFPELPKEIRLQIWKEAAIPPRILKLKPEVTPLDIRRAPPFLYLIGGLDPPLRHFTDVEQDRPAEPYYTVYLMPFEFESPPGLHVCKESRDIGFESGYEVWKMEDRTGRNRNVMWNPQKDFVVFEEHELVRSPMELFVEQYPDRAREVRQLAVKSSVWKPIDQSFPILMLPLLQMHKVKQVVVLIDEKYERAQVKGLRRQQSVTAAWDLPLDVRHNVACCFRDLPRNHREGCPLAARKAPEVRVAWNEEGLLGDEALEMKLRIWPCDSLGMLSEPSPTKPKEPRSKKSSRLTGLKKMFALLSRRRS